METPSILVRLKNKLPNKRGELPVILQVTFKGKVYPKGLGISVTPDRFKRERIVGGDKETMYQNIKIQEAISELTRKFFAMAERGPLTPEIIKAILTGEEVSNLTMLQVFDKVEMLYKNQLSAHRLSCIKSAVVKFNAWASSIPVDQVTATTLMMFEGYLRKERKHKETTIWSDMMDLKVTINKALQHKIIANNPFEGYKAPTYKQPKREYLQPEEVLKMENYADDPEKNKMLRTVAAWFILGCYSGMRYSDLGQWDEDKMTRGNRLYFSDVKTNTPHFVPIYPKLRQAIERVRDYRPIPENQVCNRSLKEVAAACDIETKLTMHVARHTFAVTYLDMGGTKDVLQKLMGHKKIQTTAIYGQITDKRIEEEAAKVFK